MKLSNEPVAIPGAIMAVLVAGLGLAVLFGVPLSEAQVGGITTFAGAVIGLVTAYQRRSSTPNGKVNERIEAGKRLAEGSELGVPDARE